MIRTGKNKLKRIPECFGADPEVEEWLRTIPWGYKSDNINEIILTYLKKGYVINEDLLLKRKEGLLIEIDSDGRNILKNYEIKKNDY